MEKISHTSSAGDSTSFQQEVPRHVLMIGYVWPETNASAAGLRDWALMEHFRQEGWTVTYASPAKENVFSEKLRSLGLETFSCEANDSRFDEFLKRIQPDFVVFDRFITEEQFGWRVEESCPNAVRIVDTQDLHCLRRAREAALKSESTMREPHLAFLMEHAREDFLREMSSVLRSDLTWIISSAEEKLLLDAGVPRKQISLLRFSYPDILGENSNEQFDFDHRKHYVTIGNFRHAPNADAVRWLKKDIWPALRRLSEKGTELHIYGAYPSKEMMSLDDPKTGFRVLGLAENQYETLRKYRVLLAPLRFGAGIKGKIADAWWSGTPVITTPIGAEGMTSLHPFAGEICNSVETFAAAAHSVYENAPDWKKLQQTGWQIITEEYSQGKNQPRIIAELVALQENISSVREKNWLGALLQKNQLRSTKYFSKWIEAKQKLAGSSNTSNP